VAVLHTITKVGPLLDLFTVDRPEWGVSEAAEAIGMPRSSTHALLTSLVETGLLSTPGRGRYRLGWRIVELYETLRSGLDLRAAAAAVLVALNNETGETTNLAVLDRGDVLYLDKIVSRQQVSVHGMRPGSRLEPHCSALGKVLLAFSPPVEAERIVRSKPLKRFTAGTITDPERLLQALEEIRRAGVGYENEEVVADVACVAAPVRDPYGALAGAISLTVPVTRMKPRRAELTKAVRAAAAQVARNLVDQQGAERPVPSGQPSPISADWQAD
jgi:DNA-binding IclR family transcriptional regulator